MATETTPKPLPLDQMPSLKMPRHRQSEEPIGRWENRCQITTKIEGSVALICDRPRGHKGLHRGRLADCTYGSARFIGYGAHAGSAATE